MNFISWLVSLCDTLVKIFACPGKLLIALKIRDVWGGVMVGSDPFSFFTFFSFDWMSEELSAPEKNAR